MLLQQSGEPVSQSSRFRRQNSAPSSSRIEGYHVDYLFTSLKATSGYGEEFAISENSGSSTGEKNKTDFFKLGKTMRDTHDALPELDEKFASSLKNSRTDGPPPNWRDTICEVAVPVNMNHLRDTGAVAREMLRMKEIIGTTISNHDQLRIKLMEVKRTRRNSVGKLWTEGRDAQSPFKKIKAAPDSGNKKAAESKRRTHTRLLASEYRLCPAVGLYQYTPSSNHVSESSMAKLALASGIQAVIQDTLHEVLGERTDPERLTKAPSSSLADLLDSRLRMFAEDQLRQETHPNVDRVCQDIKLELEFMTGWSD
ncbi:hypothetical protein HDU78_008317 [Chytriomyces hyalinus]|nr:hypothetical protein HDU78_008317 [Chytriomyces hyalinus]